MRVYTCSSSSSSSSVVVVVAVILPMINLKQTATVMLPVAKYYCTLVHCCICYDIVINTARSFSVWTDVSGVVIIARGVGGDGHGSRAACPRVEKMMHRNSLEHALRFIDFAVNERSTF